MLRFPLTAAQLFNHFPEGKAADTGIVILISLTKKN
jgi:hypothetical protein